LINLLNNSKLSNNNNNLLIRRSSVISQKHQEVQPIKSIEYLEELLSEGYRIKGPRNDPEKDVKTFQIFIKKNHEFAPETWLTNNGYKYVEPSTFTKGHRIAYKIIDGFPDEQFNSNYSLLKNDKEIVLYLKKEVPKIE